MKIEIITSDIDNPRLLREFTQRKVQFAMDRINAQARRVVIQLKSSNSSTESGLCRIDVELGCDEQIHVSAHGNSAFDSVLQALRNLETALKPDQDRGRIHYRDGH